MTFRRLAPILALLGLGLFASSPSAAPAAVHYAITPELRGGQLADLKITVAFPTVKGRSYTVVVPDDDALETVAFSIEGGEWIGGDKPRERRLTVKASSAQVTVAYHLPAAPGDMRAPNQRTLVRAAGFSMRGEDVLLAPEGFEKRTATTSIAAAPGWTMTTSLDRPAPMARVGDSLFLGGADYRVATRTVDGVAYRLVYPETFAPKAAELLKTASSIMAAQQRFWGTRPEPVYIGLVELRDDMNFSGRGLNGGFVLYLGRHADPTAVPRLIAHENLHRWITRAIGGFPDKDSDLEAWLHEGFTEAYTARLLVDAGIWLPQDYVDDWNNALARYGTSPVKTAPNTRILADRQRDFDVNRLPYDRGRLLALKWDRDFRARTKGRVGLDDVLRAQIAEAARLEREGRPVSAGRLFPRVAKRLTGLDLAADYSRYVDDGDALMAAADAFGPCIDVAWLTQPVFDRGFDLDATLAAGGRVTGLIPGGPAERAGLKAGERIHVDEIPTNDSRMVLSYEVDDGAGRRRTVNYRPEGKGSVTFQQLTLKPERPGTCRLP
jgi:predicted metalloprotease with PDZ domain